MFEQAANISPKEIKAYRNFVSCLQVEYRLANLSDPANDPFFSVENATSWITSLGYQFYLLQDQPVASVTLQCRGRFYKRIESLPQLCKSCTYRRLKCD